MSVYGIAYVIAYGLIQLSLEIILKRTHAPDYCSVCTWFNCFCFVLFRFISFVWHHVSSLFLYHLARESIPFYLFQKVRLPLSFLLPLHSNHLFWFLLSVSFSITWHICILVLMCAFVCVCGCNLKKKKPGNYSNNFCLVANGRKRNSMLNLTRKKLKSLRKYQCKNFVFLLYKTGNNINTGIENTNALTVTESCTASIFGSEGELHRIVVNIYLYVALFFSSDARFVFSFLSLLLRSFLSILQPSMRQMYCWRKLLLHIQHGLY